MPQGRDKSTLDLFSWEPPELVKRYEEKRVRSPSLKARIARAVRESLKECSRSREQIAVQMSEWLGEEITKNMLDAYASEAREEHTISYLRLLALVHVTDDARLLQLGAEMFGRSVVEDRFLPWVEVGQLADRQADIAKALDAAKRQARKGVRS